MTASIDLEDPLSEKSEAEREEVLTQLIAFCGKEGQQHLIAVAMAACHYADKDKTGLGANLTYQLLRDFKELHYDGFVTDRFFNNELNLRRFVCRQIDTPLRDDQHDEAIRILVVMVLFLMELMRKPCANAITGYPGFRHFVSGTSFFADAERIIEDPVSAGEYFANINMQVMREYLDITSRAFKITDTTTHWINQKLFSDGVKQRNYICYRYAVKQADIPVPLLIKSYMQIKLDLSGTARMMHFYHRNESGIIRRTNGGLIELEEAVYFFGVSAILGGDGQPGPAKGMKLMATRRDDIGKNPAFFPAVVLTTNKSFSPLAGRILFIETDAKDSRDIRLGRTGITGNEQEGVGRLGDDLGEFIDRSTTEEKILKALEITSPQFAIRPFN